MGVELTKSVFQSGLVCPRRAYFDVHSRDLRKRPSKGDEARMQMGQEIGRYARRLYKGVLIERLSTDMEGAAGDTQRAIDDGAAVLFEAAFVTSLGSVRADVLERLDGNKWHLIEVKSSKAAKDEHVTDLAFQWIVLEAAGIAIEKCSLILINGDYEAKDGEVRPPELFHTEDVTASVAPLLEGVKDEAKEIAALLEAPLAPEVVPNVHCIRGGTCGYFEHCFRGLSKNDVTSLPLVKATFVEELHSLGLRNIAEFPSDAKLTSRQRLVHSVVKSGIPFVSDELASVLGAMKGPIGFVDFETVSSAIPMYPGTKPYEAVPFQWSLHIVDDGILHKEFLHPDPTDPRGAFAASLWEGLQGIETIVHYASYERTILARLAEAGVPFAAECLEAIKDRGVDLEKIVLAHVYLEEFRGRSSIKRVYPALVPGAGYGDLEVQDGDHAAVEYRRMFSSATTPEIKSQIVRSLLDYCERDTQAMVEVFQALKQLALTPSHPDA